MFPVPLINTSWRKREVLTPVPSSITMVDALTVKTTKAAVSNFIPIVGKILRRCSGYGYEL